MRLHGAKYDYKISYEDIGKLFLLHKPDGVSAAIVISLEKPIRQGNQKYSHLVLQSHRLEHTIQVLLLFCCMFSNRSFVLFFSLI
jgi:structure-specific recognition protein 1